MLDVLMGILRSLSFYSIVVDGTKGVLTRCGKVRRVLEPGFYWTLPIVHTVYHRTTVDQLVRLDPQSLVTRDGRSVLVGVTVGYRVSDVVAALFHVEDVDETLQEAAIGVTASCVCDKTWHECVAGRSDLEVAIAQALSEQLRQWGISVTTVRITDLAPHRVLRLFGAEQIV